MVKNSKVALVTGSSQGIGESIVKKLASEGYFTFVTYYKNKGLGEKVVNEIIQRGGNATLVELDVKSEESVKKVFGQIEKDFGMLNILVNNAGIEIPKKIEDLGFEEWKSVMDTKINGNFLCTKYALPLLKNQDNANLIIIVSFIGEKPDPDYPAYSVATAATIAFAKMMAVDLGKYGIRTNAIAPGTTRTGMWDTMGGSDQCMWDGFAKRNPMGKISTSEDIANAAMMLINDKSNFINGNIIYMNGGSHLK